MTRIEHAPSLRPTRPVVVDVHTPALAPPPALPAESVTAPAGIAIYFRIGADALRAARPDLAALILTEAPALASDELTLEIIARPASSRGYNAKDQSSNQHASFRATLHGPRGSTILPTPADANVSIIIDSSLALIHADVTHNDAALLRATARSGTARVAPLLYARTSLLGTLNLPGGRYEPDHAEVLV